MNSQVKLDPAAITSKQADVSPEEWQLRVDLAAAYRLVALYGWDDLIFTHLSARIPGDEHHFLINPYGLRYDEVTAENLSVNQNDGTALFTGDVIVGQGEMRLSAPRVLVVYAKDRSEIARLEARGGVTLVSGAEAAEGDSADYDVEAGIIVMTGNVLLTQGGSALTADKIAVHHRHSALPGALSQQCFTLDLFTRVKWRGAQVKHQLRTLRACRRRWAVLPDVFADTDRRRYAKEIEHQAFLAFPEIAFLIKYAVIRQALFEILILHATAIKHPGGVVQSIFATPGITDNDVGFTSCLRDALQCAIDAMRKAGTKQQVFRRIAGDHQLGEQYQLRIVGRRGPRNGIENFVGIALDIPHHGVNLSSHNAKRGH